MLLLWQRDADVRAIPVRDISVTKEPGALAVQALSNYVLGLSLGLYTISVDKWQLDARLFAQSGRSREALADASFACSKNTSSIR